MYLVSSNFPTQSKLLPVKINILSKGVHFYYETFTFFHLSTNWVKDVGPGWNWNRHTE